jgi:hypothetical protein
MRDYLNKALLLIPLIAKENETMQKWITPGFIGAYYKDTNKPQWEEKIIMVFNIREMNIRPILNWNNSEYRYETYSEEHNGKIYNIFAYQIPPKYKKDFNLITSGNYSKVSLQVKSLITNFYFKSKKGKTNPLYEMVEKILYPPITETLTKKREYTGAFGGKQILNINQVPLS